MCDTIRRGRFPDPWDRIAPPRAPSPALVDLADTFLLLQESRHAADYDPAARFARRDVQDLVQRSEKAFRLWRRLNRHERDILLLALLFGRPVRR